MQLTGQTSRLLLAPCSAGVAQLVEHHLAKVDVESSSLFARSIFLSPSFERDFCFSENKQVAVGALDLGLVALGLLPSLQVNQV